jgi:hypothetical protein
MTENNRFPDDNANDENTENTGAFPEIPEPTPEDFQNDNAYVERETYSLGKIGADDVQDGYTYIDPETMTHHKKVILVSYCICGGPVTEPDDTHRCVDCEKVCCARCRIRLRRRTRCPICAEKAYALNKSLYRTLLLLDEGVMSVTDLTTTEVNNDGVTVRIDRTVPALLQLDYLRIEEEDGRTTQDANNRFTLSDSDTLSNAGKEALTVGNHVYSDDPDIKQLQEQIPIMKVANQDYD